MSQHNERQKPGKKTPGKENAIDVGNAFESGVDISERIESIVQEVAEVTDFEPTEELGRSRYWAADQVGAAHFYGTHEDRPAVLKIQGDKPNISEADILEAFTAQNKSTIIRSAKLFDVLPWDDARGYEALILEHVQGDKILHSKRPQSSKAIARFLELYQEYRRNCIPAEPWIAHPDEKPDFTEMTEKAIKVAQKQFPDDTRRAPGDFDLAREAAGVLQEFYTDVDLGFLHGHFSVEDLHEAGDGSDDVVLFSHLFWKWKYPYYDAVFGYHWFMYELSAYKQGITPQEVEEQRQRWMDALYALPTVKGSEQDQRLLEAALLERATAGLIIDGYLANPDAEISPYLIDATREQVQMLMEKLK